MVEITEMIDPLLCPLLQTSNVCYNCSKVSLQIKRRYKYFDRFKGLLTDNALHPICSLPADQLRRGLYLGK